MYLIRENPINTSCRKFYRPLTYGYTVSRIFYWFFFISFVGATDTDSSLFLNTKLGFSILKYSFVKGEASHLWVRRIGVAVFFPPKVDMGLELNRWDLKCKKWFRLIFYSAKIVNMLKFLPVLWYSFNCFLKKIEVFHGIMPILQRLRSNFQVMCPTNGFLSESQNSG